MRKVYIFSLLLVTGLVLSQIVPHLLGDSFYSFKTVTDGLLYISLAFIMINVGREFEINKKHWRSYTVDYFVAMGAAAFHGYLSHCIICSPWHLRRCRFGITAISGKRLFS